MTQNRKGMKGLTVFESLVAEGRFMVDLETGTVINKKGKVLGGIYDTPTGKIKSLAFMHEGRQYGIRLGQYIALKTGMITLDDWGKVRIVPVNGDYTDVSPENIELVRTSGAKLEIGKTPAVKLIRTKALVKGSKYNLVSQRMLKSEPLTPTMLSKYLDIACKLESENGRNSLLSLKNIASAISNYDGDRNELYKVIRAKQKQFAKETDNADVDIQIIIALVEVNDEIRAAYSEDLIDELHVVTRISSDTIRRHFMKSTLGYLETAEAISEGIKKLYEKETILDKRAWLLELYFNFRAALDIKIMLTQNNTKIEYKEVEFISMSYSYLKTGGDNTQVYKKYETMSWRKTWAVIEHMNNTNYTDAEYLIAGVDSIGYIKYDVMNNTFKFFNTFTAAASGEKITVIPCNNNSTVQGEEVELCITNQK
jgi:hypothetical protein